MDDLFWKSLRTFLKPIAALWEGHQASKLYINSPDDVWVEVEGRLEQTSVQLSQEQLLHTVRHLAQLSGVLIDEENPFFSQSLEDGTKITVLLPPWVEEGPVVVLEREEQPYIHLTQMLQDDFLSEPAAVFLKAALQNKRSMWIVGGESTGKSTLLRALAEHLPAAERTILLAERGPLEIHHPHLIHLHRPKKDTDIRGERTPSLGEVLTKLRPQRILIEDLDPSVMGEIYPLSLSRFMGSLVSFSALDAWHALSVFEGFSSALFSGSSSYAQRVQIAASVSLVLTCHRDAQGRVFLRSIDEIVSVDTNGQFLLRPIFRRFETEGSANGEAPRLLPVGLLPSFWSSLASTHGELGDPAFYHPANYDLAYQRKDETGQLAFEHSLSLSPLPHLADWLTILEEEAERAKNQTFSRRRGPHLSLSPEIERELHGDKQATDLFAVLGSVLSTLSQQSSKSQNTSPSLDELQADAVEQTQIPQRKATPAPQKKEAYEEFVPTNTAQVGGEELGASADPTYSVQDQGFVQGSAVDFDRPALETQQALSAHDLPQPVPSLSGIQEPALYDVSFDEDQLESTHLTQLSDVLEKEKEYARAQRAASSTPMEELPHVSYQVEEPNMIEQPPAWPSSSQIPSAHMESYSSHKQKSVGPSGLSAQYEPQVNTDELAEEDLHVARIELPHQPVLPRPNGNTQVTDLPAEKAYAMLQQAPPSRVSSAQMAGHHPSRGTQPAPAYSQAGHPTGVAYGRGNMEAAPHEVAYMPQPAGQDIAHLMGQPTQLSPAPVVGKSSPAVAVKRGQRQSLDEMGIFALDPSETTAVRSRQQEAPTHRPEATAVRLESPLSSEMDMLPYVSSPSLQAVSPPPIPSEAKRTSPPPPPAAAMRKVAKAPEKPALPGPGEKVQISFAPESKREPEKPNIPKPSRPSIPKPSVPPPQATPSQAGMASVPRPTAVGKGMVSLPIDPFAPDDATLIRTRKPKK
ncbi:MAG: Flp pilus assembly complex ATPase component TadA [Myxococcales bacterium]|nr:Flp pilus assembly complex ATPase component TadA [Myxococcales bacterium]